MVKVPRLLGVEYFVARQRHTAPLLPRALSRLRRGRQPALADVPSHPEAGLTPLVAALAQVIKQHTLHPNGLNNRC